MKNNKIYYFNRWINFILNHVYILIILSWVGIAILFFIFGKELLSNYGGSSDLKINLIVLGIDITLNLVIALITKLIKKVFNLNRYLKHKLYPPFRRILRKIRIKLLRLIGNNQINIHYFYNLTLTLEQKAIIDTIISKLNNTDNISKTHKNIIWIQGDSFTGKTTAISSFLIELISINRNYSVFKTSDDKIIYIDFLYDDMDEFLKYYTSLKYQDDILILDNTYLLSDKRLLLLCKEIASISAKLIIVCMRSFHESTCNSLIIEKLKAIINRNGVPLHTSQIKIDLLCLQENKINFLYNSQLQIEPNDIVKMHCFNLLSRKDLHGELMAEITNYLKGNIDVNNTTHKIIIVISILSVFTGEFDKKTFFSFFKKKRLSVINILSELYSLGFISRAPYGFSEKYIFNTKVAEHYLKIAYYSDSSKDIVMQVMTYQYYYYQEKNHYLAFLYGYFVEDMAVQRKLFDSIAYNLNFLEMMNKLNYLFSLNNQGKSKYKREIGIIYDRVGYFSQSRHYLKSLLNESIDSNNMDLAAESFYRLVQINHCEYNNYEKIKNYNSKLLFLNLQKDYWNLHIEMHKGNFYFEKYINLLDRAKKLCNNEVSYDTLHFLRRIYFDAFRLYYLDGSMNKNNLFRIKRIGLHIENYLRKNLGEFELYNKKFSVLFLLCKDALFNLLLDETIIEKDVFDCFFNGMGIDYSRMSNSTDIVNISINLCEYLEKEFESVGDKTFNFIRYYRTELLITKNDPTCKALIKQYRDFGIDEFEYRLYAEFLELKYRISQLVNLNTIERDSDDEYNYKKHLVKEQLGVINCFLSSSYKNDYAIMRYKIYELLLSIKNKKSADHYLALLEQAITFSESHNYKRESKILKILKESNCKIAPGWCNQILLFYPIIPQ